MNPQNLIMIVSLIMRCIMRLLAFQCTPAPNHLDDCDVAPPAVKTSPASCAPTAPTCPRRPTRPSASLRHAASCARQPPLSRHPRVQSTNRGHTRAHAEAGAPGGGRPGVPRGHALYKPLLPIAPFCCLPRAPAGPASPSSTSSFPSGVCSLGSWGYSHASARVSWSAAAPPSTRMLGLANSRRCVRSGLAPNPHTQTQADA